MTVIPAQVAGVKRIVVVSPRPVKETLGAAHLLGVSEFYRVGGAHAIAALRARKWSAPMRWCGPWCRGSTRIEPLRWGH